MVIFFDNMVMIKIGNKLSLLFLRMFLKDIYWFINLESFMYILKVFEVFRVRLFRKYFENVLILVWFRSMKIILILIVFDGVFLEFNFSNYKLFFKFKSILNVN